MALHPLRAHGTRHRHGRRRHGGAVSVHDGVDVDIVELAGAGRPRREVLRQPSTTAYLSRPNVHLRVDDGRNYLMLTRRRYDIVTADVIHPIFAGSGQSAIRASKLQLIRRV